MRISLFHVVLSNASSTLNPTRSTYVLQEYFPSGFLTSSSSLSWYWSIYQSSDHAPFVRSVDMSVPLKPFLCVSCVTGPMFPDRLICSLRILSFFLFSSLFSWFFVVAYVFDAPYTNAKKKMPASENILEMGTRCC